MENKTVDKEYSLSAVPQGNRQGFWRMFVVMVGFTFFSASMMSGGSLGDGLPFMDFVLIVLLGNFVLGAYTGLLAFIASKTGLSTHLLTRYAFGEKGSYLSSFMLATTQVGWFGVGVAMFALPVEKVTGINEYFLIAVAGILMTITAYFGMKALTILSLIAVPSITVFGLYSVSVATESMGGISELMNYQPVEMLGAAAALTICIGSFISGGTLTPDFARFANTKKNAVITTVIAFFLGNSLMFLFGAIGAISTGESDISEVMFLQGLIIPAIVILGLNIWTTNDSSLYASGLGFANITKLPKDKIVIFNGIVGTILALWLYNNFVGWLTFLGSTLPPIGAIIMADYFVVRKGVYPSFDSTTFKSINWIAILAWVIGVLSATYVPGVPPINALLASVISYIVIMKAVESASNKKNLLKRVS
ncbi:cytosine permease [Halalkalibacter hemicellulosilyticus]|uniref:Cytosine permease n=1 Tax=Halalkalibacter hemicellulosilyticusJCM 9152 TaxID=1236971 RepID=W4QF39_9BACI|nr:cytosine permease [Halalkalibacter hemicellulosilyticus]GAE29929.1 cytosine permease [Halalkalibacter hemicellulosilyticusJCM 9152]